MKCTLKSSGRIANHQQLIKRHFRAQQQLLRRKWKALSITHCRYFSRKYVFIIFNSNVLHIVRRIWRIWRGLEHSTLIQILNDECIISDRTVCSAQIVRIWMKIVHLVEKIPEILYFLNVRLHIVKANTDFKLKILSTTICKFSIIWSIHRAWLLERNMNECVEI